MDMKVLLEKMWKFSGEEVGQKPGDQVRGSEKAKKSKSGKHPFAGRLVGASESQENFLKGLAQIAEDTTLERKLAERWEEFKEELLGVNKKRQSRPGSRPGRGHEPVERYKKVKEYGADNSPKIADPQAAKNAMQATTQLKSATNNPAPAPNIMKALDAASQGKQVSTTDMKAIEPMMDLLQKTATDPKLANQFKTLASQAKTIK